MPVRLRDWQEVYEPFPATSEHQAGRCMDCGIPFCNNGCPLGNLIPDWNDLVYRDHWRDAIERLHATNNFPSSPGRLCPAPCEAACVLGINQDPVAIKQVEVEIVERAWDEGWITPQPPTVNRQAGRGRRLGSGGARRGPAADAPVTTWSCSSGPTASAGCCATASPSSRWRSGSSTAARADGSRGHGVPACVERRRRRHLDELRAEFDAIVLAGGATAWRDLPIPGP